MVWSHICELITFQITLYVIFIKIFNGKIRKSFICYPILLFLAICFLEHTNYHDLLFFLCDIALYFILPLIFIKGIEKAIIIYVSLVMVGFFSLTTVITSFFTAFIIPFNTATNAISIISNILLMLLFLFLSINKRISDYISRIHSASKGIKFLFIFFIWELVFLISLLTVTLSEFSNIPIISISCFVIVIILINSFFVFNLLIASNLRNKYYKKLNKNIINDMDKQTHHYEQLSIANENLRKFCHDFNNLKIGLNTYLKANDTVGALNYLNDCDMLIETSNEILHTGHHIVDALFSDKLQIAKENSISINFEGLIPSDILTPVDLCIIFGNTLDNAIEACLKIENNTEKVINVTVKQNHDYIFVTFTNPCVENVEIKNNTILTTKENTEMHGIGLYSIKQVLKNYDGHLTLHCENNIFTTEIDFCIST